MTALLAFKNKAEGALASGGELRSLKSADPGWHTRLASVCLSALGTLKETLAQRGSEGQAMLRRLIPSPISVTPRVG